MHHQVAPPHDARQQTLAHRLFHLAEDTDRAGLHREATVLLTVAMSVLQGRDIVIGEGGHGRV